jgi:hypothetical protein
MGFVPPFMRRPLSTWTSAGFLGGEPPACFPDKVFAKRFAEKLPEQPGSPPGSAEAIYPMDA